MATAAFYYAPLHFEGPAYDESLSQQYTEKVTVDYDRTVEQVEENIWDSFEQFHDEKYVLFHPTAVQVPIQVPSVQLASTDAEDDAMETLWNRVYVSPQEVAAEFITEFSQHDIVVWNAYFYQNVDLTDVQVINQDGTGLTYPNLPKTIPRTWNEVLDLDIYEDGPPTQDTDWKITVAGTEFNLDVTGIRVIAYTANVDFNTPPQLVYSFLTSIARHPRYLKEQRRPIQRLPFRNIDLTAHSEGLELQKLSNLLHYGKNKVFAVPIYTEGMQIASFGSSSLTVSTDPTYLYNLQNNCEYCMILNHSTGLGEVKSLTSLVGSVLSFGSSISGSYTIYNSSVYPCVFSYVKSAKITPETKGQGVIVVSFGEFKRTSGI